jgi:hypothetical protein
MKTQDAETMIRQLYDANGIPHYNLVFYNSVSPLAFHSPDNFIALSMPMIHFNDEDVVTSVALHEVCHALDAAEQARETGYLIVDEAHGTNFQKFCRMIDAPVSTDELCFDHTFVGMHNCMIEHKASRDAAWQYKLDIAETVEKKTRNGVQGETFYFYASPESVHAPAEPAASAAPNPTTSLSEGISLIAEKIGYREYRYTLHSGGHVEVLAQDKSVWPEPAKKIIELEKEIDGKRKKINDQVLVAYCNEPPTLSYL